jgi:hypothetical protein
VGHLAGQAEAQKEVASRQVIAAFGLTENIALRPELGRDSGDLGHVCESGLLVLGCWRTRAISWSRLQVDVPNPYLS